MPHPLRQTAAQAARLQANVAGTRHKPPQRDYRKDIERGATLTDKLPVRARKALARIAKALKEHERER